MTTPAKPGAQATTETTPTPAVETVTQTPAAAAPAAAPVVAAKSDASDERARIKAIQGCAEAKGRETLASHLAFETSMTADEAKALLAASPKAAAEEPKAENPFAAAMAHDNPNVGADGQVRTEGTSSGTPNRSAALLRDYGEASGRTFK